MQPDHRSAHSFNLADADAIIEPFRAKGIKVALASESLQKGVHKIRASVEAVALAVCSMVNGNSLGAGSQLLSAFSLARYHGLVMGEPDEPNASTTSTAALMMGDEIDSSFAYNRSSAA
jgi:hypothetical protein